MVEEERASGISPPEPTEVETAIMEIIERGKRHKMLWLGETKMQWRKKGKRAESVRKRSMERLAETREKESQGYGKKVK